MSIKKTIIGVALVSIFQSGSSFAVNETSCENYNSNTKRCYYHRAYAARYARDNWNKTGKNDWGYVDGTWVRYPYNCTNFVSQSILAGFVAKNISRQELFEYRNDYSADKSQSYGNKWYYISETDRGEAWQGVDFLHRYAKTNKDSYKGLHFEKIASGKPDAINLENVQLGDIIFLISPQNVDAYHALIVSGYNYNNYPSDNPKLYLMVAGNTSDYNKELYKVMSSNPNKTYEIFRPTFYSDIGLGNKV